MSEAETIIVRSWNELVDNLFEHSWVPSIERFRSNYAFRGLSDKDYELKSSLTRLGGDYSILEKHLIRNFKKYAHRNVVPSDSIWNWLTVAQHHGLPTRLMDWTYSPFIAMHFATANIERVHLDGIIWCVDYVRAHELLPARLRTLLEQEGCNAFTVQLLTDGANSLTDFDALSPEDFVSFFEPPSLDDRIVNQYALFSVISNPNSFMDAWLEKHPSLWRKIVIPSELKWEVRDKLDQANITERVMFPGLDGLCTWLKRHYSPKASDDIVHDQDWQMER
jgi:FRG domain-containing protein